MIVKRFSGKTAEEALSLAKWELGDQAVILSSGKARDRWWKFWENGFQVLVAADFQSPTARSAKPEPELRRGTGSEPDVFGEDAVAAASLVRGGGREGPGPGDSRLDTVLELLHGVERRLGRIEGVPSGRAEEAYRWLTDQELPETWARTLAEEVGESEEDSQPIARLIAAAVARRLGAPSPLSAAGPAVVTLIGPTGSGKTTTAAKLAAYFRLQQNKSVSVITTDTFRVAAVEQIRTYGEILGIPVDVALRPQEIPALVKKNSADVVLVDTAGHSLNHALHMSELHTILKKTRSSEILLTMPATMQSGWLVDMAKRFAGDFPVKLCITKVDEAVRAGPVVGAALTLGWPLAYVTDGQGVPDDIRVAGGDMLGQWLAGGDYHG